MTKLTNIKAVIVEDFPPARKLLKLMLQELAPEVAIVAEAENGNTGIEAIKKLQPDVAFMDIEMPEKSGLELAEELLQQNIKCDIIFITAFNEYAIQAFRLSAVDYLLKPIKENELLEAVEKIKQRKSLSHLENRLQVLVQNLNPTSENIISIPTQNGYDYVPVKEIEYIEADGSYAHIFLLNKKQITVSKNLKYFEQTLLPFSNFKRPHRSFIINTNYMISYSKSGRGTITMKSGQIIDLARDRKADFFNL